MKKVFYIILSIGIILVLLSVIFKETHLQGAHGLRLSGACALLLAMLLYLFLVIRNKNKAIP